MRKAVKIDYASINLGLLLFMSLNPYPRWFLPAGILQIFFLVTTIITFFITDFRTARVRRSLIAAIAAYIIYFTLPIVHGFKSGYFIYYLLFIAILFYPRSVYLSAYKLLKKIIVFVLICSLVVWVIHLFGLELPHYTYILPAKAERNMDLMRIYGPCLSMFRGAVFIGGKMERLCGVFAEPGHCGIYLGLILAIEKFKISGRQNIIILISGILTFSTAFYGILLMGIVCRQFNSFKYGMDFQLMFVAALIMVVFLLNKSLYESATDRVFERISDSGQEDGFFVLSVVDSRTYSFTLYDYERFSKTTDIIYGRGDVDVKEMISTNWRGYIYRYGIVGLIIAAILLLTITSGPDLIYRLLLISIALLIFSHRSYLLYPPGIYMMLYTATVINNPFPVRRKPSLFHLPFPLQNENTDSSEQ